MFPTIALKNVAVKWVNAIANSTAINDYCMATFGKLPKVYVGVDTRHKPLATDCPFIVVSGLVKQEGLEKGTYQYIGSVGWVILDNAVATVTDRVHTLEGIYKLDDLGQLIWQAIAEINPNYPISELNYGIDMLDYIPQYAGNAEITVNVPVTMGTTLDY